MPLRITRSLKGYENPDQFGQFAGDMDEIIQSIENYVNSQPIVTTRLGSTDPLPQSPKQRDVMLDYSTGTLRTAIFNGNSWVYQP